MMFVMPVINLVMYENNLLLTDENLHNLEAKLNNELCNVYKWVSANKLALYIKKRQITSYFKIDMSPIT